MTIMRSDQGLPSLVSILLVVVVCASVSLAEAAEWRVDAGYSEIVFDPNSGFPVEWVVCSAACADENSRRSILVGRNDGYLRNARSNGASTAFDVSVTEHPDEVRVELSRQRSAEPDQSRESYVYRLQRDSAEVIVELPEKTNFEFQTGVDFIPEQLPGFGQIYSRVKAVQVDADGQEVFELDEVSEVDLPPATSTNWTGARSRYWTFLVQPLAGENTVTVDLAIRDQPGFSLVAGPGDGAAFRIYAGPVEWQSLKRVSPELSEMLFAALWDFLRALCFGMMILLGWLYKFVGSYGLAIILLSLSVKILMSPLTMLADRWQADVNRQHTLLKPELDEVKQHYKGEEAHRRVLLVYKKHNVSQFYTFKSAAGFLIQIPVFIAAFDMLAENIALNEVAFLWMADLAEPDRLARLPFVLPFFGGWLNLLPFLMTGLSTLAAWLQAEEALSADLQRQQSIRLYLMSAAFFVLFYTFPAGMVLYWTSSNLFHLIKVESGRVFSSLKTEKG